MSSGAVTFLAALIWHLGCAALFWRGAVLIFEAGTLDAGRAWTWLAVPAAAVIGYLKARFLLVRAARANVSRIARLDRPRPWHVYRPGFFLFLVLNVALARWLIVLSRGHYELTLLCGVMLLAIAFALLFSSFVWWRAPKEAPGDP